MSKNNKRVRNPPKVNLNKVCNIELWKSVFIAVLIVMGWVCSRDEYAIHLIKGLMMLFWKKKNKNISEKISVISIDKKAEEAWGYVEIFSLAQRLVYLNQLVSRIEEISFTKNDSALMNYQLCLRAAFIDEFEQNYKELFGKTMPYENFKKTRSTL